MPNTVNKENGLGLVLIRRLNESFSLRIDHLPPETKLSDVFGDNLESIRIMPVQYDCGEVKISIKAPRQVRIQRSEIESRFPPSETIK